MKKCVTGIINQIFKENIKNRENKTKNQENDKNAQIEELCEGASFEKIQAELKSARDFLTRVEQRENNGEGR